MEHSNLLYVTEEQTGSLDEAVIAIDLLSNAMQNELYALTKPPFNYKVGFSLNCVSSLNVAIRELRRIQTEMDEAIKKEYENRRTVS